MKNKTLNVYEYNKLHNKIDTCKDIYTCCDCGGNDCGCAYCWSCNACENCQNDNEKECEKLKENK